MNTAIDLHMHSGYSNDGEFSPSELMEKCAAAGLKTVALTDHNTMRGTGEARAVAQRLGLNFISGIEIDTAHGERNFHLLGYGLDENSADVAQIEKQIHNEELAASAKYIELSHKLGFYFDDAAVLAKAKNGVIVAEMIAEVVFADRRNDDNELLREFRDGGKFADNPLVSFFWEFMAKGKPAYVPMRFPDFAATVKMIHANGGLAVLAHPGANIGHNVAVAEELIAAGIDGIEVFSSYHDAATTEFYGKIAADHGLFMTIGSDFHGKAKPAVKFGKLTHPDPDSLSEKLKTIM